MGKIGVSEYKWREKMLRFVKLTTGNKMQVQGKWDIKPTEQNYMTDLPSIKKNFTLLGKNGLVIQTLGGEMVTNKLK